MVGDILAHHGVKGMKWGVRKDAGHEGEQAKTSKIAKLDKKFERNANSTRLAINTYNKAGRKYADEDIDRINSKPQYKGKDFSKDSPLRQKYYAEHQRAFVNQLEKQVSSMGTNASGTQKYTIHEKPDGSWDIVNVAVKHDDEVVNVKVHYDSNGMITGVEMPDGIMAQSGFDVEAFLAHHGVLGMKWGVRKGSSSSEPSHASSDHVQSEAVKSKLDAHGVKALSNQELRQLNERMNLEQQYKNLNGQKPSKFESGHQRVKKVIAVGKTLNDIHNTLNGPAGKLAKTAIKTAVKTAEKASEE
jgi:hypothetical protein